MRTTRPEPGLLSSLIRVHIMQQLFLVDMEGEEDDYIFSFPHQILNFQKNLKMGLGGYIIFEEDDIS